MTSFMLIISFLLHIILLIAVYHLFQQVQSLKQENTKDITNLFELYLQEIKDENNRLQEELSVSVPQHLRETIIEPRIPAVHNQVDDQIAKDNNAETYSVPLTNDIDDHYETSLQAQILQLHNQGIQVEEIAKELGCGTTEAALVIKLYEKRSLKA